MPARLPARGNTLSTPEQLIDLAHESPTVLGANPYLRGLQSDQPICLVRTPAGDPAWLVTRYAEVRKLLMDRRLGRAHPDPANAPQYVNNPMMDLLRSSTDFANEHEIHTQLRALLGPYFSGRNMGTLEPRVARIVDEAVARLASQTPPVDVQADFAQALTMRMIGELLGVPDEDQARFPALVHQASGTADDAQDAETGKDTLYAYFAELVARKRSDPGDDVLSGMALAGLTDEQGASIGLMLLYAAYGSTSTHTSLGIARIGSDPVLRDRLIAEPELMKTAVEEFLRTASGGGFTLPHYAREEIEIGAVTIRPGDLVLLDYALANFDDRVFPDPDDVDIARAPNAHLTFAHGMWHCIGAPLAKMQLGMTFTALLATLPTLRLQGGLEDIARSSGYLGGDLANLMVEW